MVYSYHIGIPHRHCVINLFSMNHKAHILLRTAFTLGTQHEKKRDKQHEIYMANAKKLRWVYLHSTDSRWGFRVRGNANFSVPVGSNGNLTFLDSTMLVSPTRISRWGADPTRSPNASSFVSQWNLGLSHVPFNIS